MTNDLGAIRSKEVSPNGPGRWLVEGAECPVADGAIQALRRRGSGVSYLPGMGEIKGLISGFEKGYGEWLAVGATYLFHVFYLYEFNNINIK